MSYSGTYLILRIFEVVLALTILLVFLPVMAIITIIIRIDSEGPAVFKQHRLGINKKHFNLYKFRTLYSDAKDRFPELYEYKYDKGNIAAIKFKEKNDPRVTRVGQWLRKSSLDELPNFWNLLKGDITLVGPRPEIPELLQYYKGDMLKKFTVRPGITGLAQISGRGDLIFIDTVKYDVKYVEERSLLFDIKIIFQTIVKCITMDGSY